MLQNIISILNKKRPNIINNILFDDSNIFLFKWTYFVIIVLKHNFDLVYEEFFS